MRLLFLRLLLFPGVMMVNVASMRDCVPRRRLVVIEKPLALSLTRHSSLTAGLSVHPNRSHQTLTRSRQFPTSARSERWTGRRTPLHHLIRKQLLQWRYLGQRPICFTHIDPFFALLRMPRLRQGCCCLLRRLAALPHRRYTDEVGRCVFVSGRLGCGVHVAAGCVTDRLRGQLRHVMAVLRLRCPGGTYAVFDTVKDEVGLRAGRWHSCVVG